jgi:hypothetical protein
MGRFEESIYLLDLSSLTKLNPTALEPAKVLENME